MMHWPQLFGVMTLILSLACGLAGAQGDGAQGDGGRGAAGKGKDKGKGHGQFVKVDLEALPPGLAKQLAQHLDGAAAKGKKGFEAKEMAKGKKDFDPKGKKEFDPKPKKDFEPRAKADDGKKKGKGGPGVGLSEAIAIAERAGHGEAVKAERKSGPAGEEFKVEVLTGAGHKARILLDAKGRLLDDGGKGKGKKKQ